VGINYTHLQSLLIAGAWWEADKETLKVMCKAADGEKAGRLSLEDINKFPCIDLRTIDQLWMKYSQGRFGFSIQKKKYPKHGRDDAETLNIFGRRVGWRENRKWARYYMLIRITTPELQGQLPVAWACGDLTESTIYWGKQDLWESGRKISCLMKRLEKCSTKEF
jgi:hypothetical protein